MIENILIIFISLLSFLTGLFSNYARWRTSGRIYKSAKKTYQNNRDLTLELGIAKATLRLKDKEIEQLKKGVVRCK